MESTQKSFELALKKGLRVVTGTDWKPGENAKELRYFVEYGMSPMRAIQAGTIEAARLLRMEHQVGSLEPGKLADVLLVDGNPLEDISILSNPDNIRLVVMDGRIEKNKV